MLSQWVEVAEHLVAHEATWTKAATITRGGGATETPGEPDAQDDGRMAGAMPGIGTWASGWEVSEGGWVDGDDNAKRDRAREDESARARGMDGWVGG